MSLDPEKRKQASALSCQRPSPVFPNCSAKRWRRQPPMFVNRSSSTAGYRALYSNRQSRKFRRFRPNTSTFNGKDRRDAAHELRARCDCPHVLGRFRDLLLATARHPAMLYPGQLAIASSAR
jgi:hypothetical protein